MSNFDLTFCKVYIYAKGCPGINLGAWHESCAHPIIYVKKLIKFHLPYTLKLNHCYHTYAPPYYFLKYKSLVDSMKGLKLGVSTLFYGVHFKQGSLCLHVKNHLISLAN